jgi:GDPmannose 4,6-dehydratase
LRRYGTGYVARRVLITGITGQDGSYLAEQLLADGCEVVGMVRPGGAGLPGSLCDRVSAVEAGLGNDDELARAVSDVAPDQLFHLAAPSFVPESWDRPGAFIGEIAGATGTLLRAAASLDSCRVFVATSAEIFGDCGESPQSELTPMRPRSPYGVAKLAAHGLVGAMRERFGLFAVSGILFNHESPRRPQHFLPRKVTRGAAAISLGLQDELVLGSLDAVRDWSHAADVMRGARLALAADEPRDYVFASGVGRTVGDLVGTAFDAASVPEAKRVVRVDPAFVRPPEPVAPVGDATLARTTLGWTPQVSFEAMIAEMVAADIEALRHS